MARGAHGRGAVRVEGLAELTRDFRKMSKELGKEVAASLREAAEPARPKAEQKAREKIRNIGSKWSTMKIGVTQGKGVVWMRPAARRSGGSPRPNLSGLLVGRAMWPAVEEAEPQVMENMAKVIDDLAGHNGFD